MVQVVKLRKGLDIRLKGTAAKQKTQISPAYEEVALMPQDFVGVTPKPVVREGDVVKAGVVCQQGLTGSGFFFSCKRHGGRYRER